MFVTFYSYKGGVGRSLALANIACLLAEDEDHPQRVLLWDFDLEAPGLHRLLPPKQPQAYGFVDLAHTYAKEGTLPEVSEYIYKSSVENIDVMPAGKVDEEYCKKLQQLDWPGFFSSDPKEPGALFGPLLESIGNLAYDYVMIDSRTGLNDQAGICTQVLPDTLVVMFRLTEQNLDGLAHVTPAIRSQLKKRHRKEVKLIPVASCVVSSASQSVADCRGQALEMFGVGKLDYIRFDPDLVSEERLFCLGAERKAVWPTPPIVSDYAKLAERIRRQNPDDTRTLADRTFRSMRTGDTTSATPMLLGLLKRRPKNQALWETYAFLSQTGAIQKDLREGFEKALDDIIEADTDNVNALLAKAIQCGSKANSPESEHLEEAKALLLRATASAPERADLLRALAGVSSCRGDLEDGIRALRRSQELTPENARVILDLVSLYLRMGSHYFASAAEELEKTPDIGDAFAGYRHPLLAYLRCSMKEYGKAGEARDAYMRIADNPHRREQVRSHFLLLEGRKDEAIRVAENAIHAGKGSLDSSDRSNWAEFFICASEFGRATDLLEGELASQTDLDDDKGSALVVLAKYLQAQEPGITKEKVISAWKRNRWDFKELILFVERARNQSPASAQRLGIIETLIRYQEVVTGRWMMIPAPWHVGVIDGAEWPIEVLPIV